MSQKLEISRKQILRNHLKITVQSTLKHWKMKHDSDLSVHFLDRKYQVFWENASKGSNFILCLPFPEAARLLNKRKVKQILQTMRRQRPRKQEKQQSGQKLGQSSLSLLLQIYYQRDSEGMLCCLLQPTESWQMLLAMGELPEWRILRRTPIPIQLIRWLDQRE